MTPFIILVTNHTKPGRDGDYLALIHDVLDAMRQEKTFVNTVLHRDVEDPTLFMLYETWLDKEDFFAVQMKRPYRQLYEATLPDILRRPREMRLFEPLRGDFVFQNSLAQTLAK